MNREGTVLYGCEWSEGSPVGCRSTSCSISWIEMKVTAGAQMKPDVYCHHGKAGAATALIGEPGQSKREISIRSAGF